MDLNVWADAYIRGYSRDEPMKSGDPDWWAFERTMFILRRDSGEEIWDFILLVLAKRPPQQVLGNLAAGPLEDLIAYDGKFFIDRVELAARQDPAFRRLLGGVWRNRTPADIWKRVELARGALGD